MNENRVVINLRNHMTSPEGWGRSKGREVYINLINYVESQPGVTTFCISVEEVKRMDFSFASETIVEIAKKYRSSKGFFLTTPIDLDVIENIDAAAARKEQPLVLWDGDEYRIIGLQPTKGTRPALEYALQQKEARASEFITVHPKMSIANASSKFKQLWSQGFLLRTENAADSGGVEYVYHRIR